MKSLVLPTLLVFSLCAFPLLAADASTAAPSASWHAQTLLQAIGNVLIFAAVGIVAAIIGFKFGELDRRRGRML